jgi:hypothetical protein
MSLQGQDVTPAMQQLVMNRKRDFDEERRHAQAGAPRQPPWRPAQGLDLGEITVQSILAAYRPPGPTLEAPAVNPRGHPESRAAVHLPPVMRAYGRTKPCAGQRGGVGTLRPSLIEPQHADIAPVTRCHTAAMGLAVWHRATPLSPASPRGGCPRKATRPASAKSDAHPRGQPATAGTCSR